MITISVMYPEGEGATFDMDYYMNTHMPLVDKHVGHVLKGKTVLQGVAGGAPGSSAPYRVMAMLQLGSMADLEEFGKNAGPLMADVPNFTNITPSMQVSEVK
ncbi:MAG: EthD family reductase [Alphaproteobacteria bacterium]